MMNDTSHSNSNNNSSINMMMPQRTSTTTTPYAWTSSIMFDEQPPFITSNSCAQSLTNFFQDTSRLAVATEASSHPAGLQALYAQPWVWAGGGLGNLEECHNGHHGSISQLYNGMQNCLAGAALRHDSLIFASVCVVPECSAYDLSSDDFVATVSRASQTATPENAELAAEYVTLMHRMQEINKFLGTGWTCGDFIVPWSVWPFGALFFTLTAVFLGAAAMGTWWKKKNTTTSTSATSPTATSLRTPKRATIDKEPSRTLSLSDDSYTTDTEEGGEKTALLLDDVDVETFSEDSPTAVNMSLHSSSFATLQNKQQLQIHENQCEQQQQQQLVVNVKNERQSYQQEQEQEQEQHESSQSSSWLACFDVTAHLKRLLQQSAPETAILDGLRVGSIVWIMLGHVMAIVSSSGAGYSNPADFLPPSGLTTTFLGQLLFASRFAVDTFLIISGFLVVHVLDRKLPLLQRQGQRDASSSPSSSSRSTTWSNLRITDTVVGRYVTNLGPLLLARVVRVLPLYAMCLLFYTQVAPHVGNSGPFWYQWLALLKPCHDYGWTNLLFVNNFIPFDKAITDTCFYHSWYLAVDMQLFIVALLLVFWYQAHPVQGRRLTLGLCITSVVLTTHLAHVRHWSVNTFDGAAVARYDVEAYAKPLIRSQAYLAGMYVAMLLPMNTLRSRSTWSFGHYVAIVVALMGMAVVTFGTAYGAYSRRPCQYHEWPSTTECGSAWSPQLTWIYTSLSRPIWIVGVAIIMHVCLGRNPAGSAVANILSWKCWVPLSHLSFGAYLIHPIVIFIWQLGSREKQVFRLMTFGMDYISVMVVSYVAAMMAAVTVEAPCASLWKTLYSNATRRRTTNDHTRPTSDSSARRLDDDAAAAAADDEELMAVSQMLASPFPAFRLNNNNNSSGSYGSIQEHHLSPSIIQ